MGGRQEHRSGLRTRPEGAGADRRLGKQCDGGGNKTNTKSFWEQDAENYDGWMDVGCRSHFLCSTYAARAMIEKKQGLILNISSFGAVRRYNSVPYAMGKTAIDRMTAD